MKADAAGQRKELGAVEVVSGNLVRAAFSADFLLLEVHGERQHKAVEAKSAESDEGNHQDGHKSLRIAFCNSPSLLAVMAVTTLCEIKQCGAPSAQPTPGRQLFGPGMLLK